MAWIMHYIFMKQMKTAMKKVRVLIDDEDTQSLEAPINGHYHKAREKSVFYTSASFEIFK